MNTVNVKTKHKTIILCTFPPIPALVEIQFKFLKALIPHSYKNFLCFLLLCDILRKSLQ